MAEREQVIIVGGVAGVREQSDMARKSNTASGGRNSSAPKKRKAPTASKGTPRESLTKRLSDDPRFVESKESWKALVIVGAKPSV